MSDFVWEPTSEYIEKANITRLMRKLGIDDYWELVRRSQDDTEWFWEAAIEDLGIEFFDPYSKLLDDSEGPNGRSGSWAGPSTSRTTALIVTL